MALFHSDQICVDVAHILRATADRREAELDAQWASIDRPDRDAIDEGRQHVFHLRAAADYHERQAARRRNLNREGVAI